MDIKNLTKKIFLLCIGMVSAHIWALSEEEKIAVNKLTVSVRLAKNDDETQELLKKFGNKIICAGHFVLAIAHKNYSILESMAKYTDVASCKDYQLAISHASEDLLRRLFNHYCFDLSMDNVNLFIKVATILTTFRPYVKKRSYDDYNYCLEHMVLGRKDFEAQDAKLLTFFVENKALQHEKLFLENALQFVKDKSIKKYLQIYSMAYHYNAIESNFKNFEHYDLRIFYTDNKKRTCF